MELLIKKEKYHRGNDSEFYTAKAVYNNINFKISAKLRFFLNLESIKH